MSKPIQFLLSVIASAVIPVSSYANNINDAPPGIPIKNLSIAQIGDWKSIPSVKDKVKAESQRELKLLVDLKAKINKLDFPNKEDVLQKITNMMNEDQKLNANNNDNRINFLEIQLADAFGMIKAVNASAILTSQVLAEMFKLANDAAQGTFSALQIKEMNIKYQAYKNTLHFAQTIHLYNGDKKLSGGDILIQFGDDASEHSRLVINLPAFDLAGLSLQDTAINTVAGAQEAMYIVSNANSIVESVISTTNMSLNDMLATILIEPTMLAHQLDLFGQAQLIAMQASNGVINDNQRANLDTAFTYIKATMTQIQTYVSLDGPKKLGYGNIHIQIGKYAVPDATLTIKIPVVDAEALGLNKLDIKTQESASSALSSINADTYKFIYG